MRNLSIPDEWLLPVEVWVGVRHDEDDEAILACLCRGMLQRAIGERTGFTRRGLDERLVRLRSRFQVDNTRDLIALVSDRAAAARVMTRTLDEQRRVIRSS